MTIGVEDIFRTFARALDTQDRQDMLVRQRSEAVVKSLRRVKLEIDRYQIIGSYARGTTIGSLAANNVDLMIELNAVKYRQWENPDAANRVARLFQETLGGASPKVPARIDGHEIRLEFPGFRLDVIPAMRWHGGTYLIPDAIQRKWLYADPQGFMDRLTLLDRRHNNFIMPLVKMIKVWNRSVGFPLCGFHIESMIIRRYDHAGHTGRLTPIIESIPAAISDFFNVLPTMLDLPLVDPILNQRVDQCLSEDNRRRAMSKAQVAAAMAGTAYDYLNQGRIEESFSAWGQLFGRSFLVPA